MASPAIRSVLANLTQVTSDGEFTGYASVWGEVDDFDTSTVRGAFSEVIAERVPKGLIKLLWAHDLDQPIGRVIEMKEDDRGLWMRGKLNLKVERAREVLALMQEGDVNGLSIGFDPTASEIVEDQNRPGVMLLNKVDLWEVSIVTLPALEEAQVDEVSITDRFMLGDAASKTRITNDGFLVTEARVARTGIQIYRGKEVGRPELDSVRVYRPPETVFEKKTAMASLAHRTVTNDHPPVLVKSDNWKKYAVGSTGGEIARDGEFIRVPLSIMDAEMIKQVRDGKKELSVGYLVAIDFKSGITPSGEEYDAVQTGIRANHIAVVDAARGGPELRIVDGNNGDRAMASTTLMVDGVNVELSDVASQIVKRAMEGFEKQIASLRSKVAEEEEKNKKAKDSMDAATAKHDVEIKAKDADIATVKKQLEDAAITPAKLNAAVAARSEVITKAKEIMGDGKVDDSKTDAEIKKQVVDAHMGDSAKGYNDVQIDAAFAAIKVEGKTTTTPAGNGGGSGNALIDAMRAKAQASTALNDADKAFDERNDYLKNAYKTPAQQAAK